MKVPTIILILLVASNAFGATPYRPYRNKALEQLKYSDGTPALDYIPYIGCKVERVADGLKGIVIGLTEPLLNGTWYFKIEYQQLYKIFRFNSWPFYDDVEVEYKRKIKKISPQEFFSQWMIVG